jgi:hypothetical protein
MDSHNSMKINRLLQAWPKGTVSVHAWLGKQGISRKLTEQYRKREWIDAVGRGAFIRRGDRVGWPGAVYAVQSELKKSVHPGGRTALGLHGLAHYLPMSESAPVYLYGAPGVRLPTWFHAHRWGQPLTYSATGLLRKDHYLSAYSFGDFSLEISAPERAILEYLDGFPRLASFDEAREIMDGLTTLRPEVVQSLLEECTSVKVKRMFLYLADQSAHRWRSELKDARIKLGSGKRVLVPEGRLDQRYLITVPANTPDTNT